MNALCLFLGHDDRRVHEPGRLFLRCDRCHRETAGWGSIVWGEAPAPKPIHTGPLTFRELCAARKRGISPAVLPPWAKATKRRRTA